MSDRSVVGVILFALGGTIILCLLDVMLSNLAVMMVIPFGFLGFTILGLGLELIANAGKSTAEKI